MSSVIQNRNHEPDNIGSIISVIQDNHPYANEHQGDFKNGKYHDPDAVPTINSANTQTHIEQANPLRYSEELKFPDQSNNPPNDPPNDAQNAPQNYSTTYCCSTNDKKKCNIPLFVIRVMLTLTVTITSFVLAKMFSENDLCPYPWDDVVHVNQWVYVFLTFNCINIILLILPFVNEEKCIYHYYQDIYNPKAPIHCKDILTIFHIFVSIIRFIWGFVGGILLSSQCNGKPVRHLLVASVVLCLIESILTLFSGCKNSSASCDCFPTF